MGLKVELKPGERLIVGECLITNSEHRTRLMIQGQAPILREKEIMLPAKADTPAKRIYLAVQLMYTARDPRAHHATYFSLMRDLLMAAPSTWPHLAAISNNIMAGEMYKALKSAKALIAYEKELLDHATRRTNLRRSGQTDRKSA
jgi:flagellar biosynthesis repressor protein FlbT